MGGLPLPLLKNGEMHKITLLNGTIFFSFLVLMFITIIVTRLAVQWMEVY